MILRKDATVICNLNWAAPIISSRTTQTRRLGILPPDTAPTTQNSARGTMSMCPIAHKIYILGQEKKQQLKLGTCSLQDI